MIVVDETIVKWYGMSDTHVTFMPRKPVSQGFMLKTLVCGTSRILLNVDLCEGEAIDADKPFNSLWGKSVGCTLRLVQPYVNTNRTVVGDSWFASVFCAIAMTMYGLYFVGCVKTGHKHYPKSHLREKCQQRGDKLYMQRDFPLKPRYPRGEVEQDPGNVRLIAGAHCDKVPLTLIASRGCNKPGATKKRVW